MGAKTSTIPQGRDPWAATAPRILHLSSQTFIQGKGRPLPRWAQPDEPQGTDTAAPGPAAGSAHQGCHSLARPAPCPQGRHAAP